MNYRLSNILRIFIMLALAVSPLRGMLASPIMTDGNGHAAMVHMQQDMSAAAGMDVMTGADKAAHNCDQCCDGKCCTQACVTGCAHTSAALLAVDTLKTTSLKDIPATQVVSIYSARSVLPLLQPPISHQPD